MDETQSESSGSSTMVMRSASSSLRGKRVISYGRAKVAVKNPMDTIIKNLGLTEEVPENWHSDKNALSKYATIAEALKKTKRDEVRSSVFYS
jgi:hypothetical protein